MVRILEKDERLRLEGKEEVRHALVALGWDVNDGQSQHDFDLDASVVLRNGSGVAVDVCYYKNLTPFPWITHTGDNLDGSGDGDDEKILIDLSRVPSDIAQLDVVVHIYHGDRRRQNFGMVENAYVRLENTDTGEEVLRCDLSNDKVYDHIGVHFASLVRVGSSWDFVNVENADPAYATLQEFCDQTVKV